MTRPSIDYGLDIVFGTSRRGVEGYYWIRHSWGVGPFEDPFECYQLWLMIQASSPREHLELWEHW